MCICKPCMVSLRASYEVAVRKSASNFVKAPHANVMSEQTVICRV